MKSGESVRQRAFISEGSPSLGGRFGGHFKHFKHSKELPQLAAGLFLCLPLGARGKGSLESQPPVHLHPG